MKLFDYNGEDIWTATAIAERFRRYATSFGLEPRDLSPRVCESEDSRWVYPVMDRVIDGIEAGDIACAQIGVDFLDDDRGFCFGALLKMRTARALRRFEKLSDDQVDRLRCRIVAMYESGTVPREFVEYRRLLRRIGAGPYWSRVEAALPVNHFAKRAAAYFKKHCRAEPTQRQVDRRPKLSKLAYDAFTERRLFGLVARTPQDVPPLLQELESRFVCFLAWDARDVPVSVVSALVEAMVRAGAVYFVCWGPDCERVHDIIDEVVSDPDNTLGLPPEAVVMTTWHADDKLADALWFFLVNAWPAAPFDDSASIGLAVTIGSDPWAQVVH
nr:hypothetical protein [Planctomycetota bacterium]